LSIKVFDQYLRIVILRCGFGGLGSLVFIRKIREIRSAKNKDGFRSTELALQTSHSDGMVGWCWLRTSRISRRNQTASTQLVSAAARWAFRAAEIPR
jgi:hypothetical protein